MVDVWLEDENGRVEEVADIKPPYTLGKLLHSVEADPSYPYLGYIDPYGDTIFNRLQLKPFLEEWDRLYKKARTDEERIAMDRVKKLALKCLESVHTYLKFVGD